MELKKIITQMLKLRGVVDPDGEYQRILAVETEKLGAQYRCSFEYKGAKHWTSEVAQIAPGTLASDIEADILEHQLRIQCNDCDLRGECERTTEDFAECHKVELALHWAYLLQCSVIRTAREVEVRSPLMDADQAYRQAAEEAIWPTEVAT